MKHHVNFSETFLNAVQSVPQSLLVAHELASMTLEYRRECTPSDIVQSLSCPGGSIGGTDMHGGLDGSVDSVSCSGLSEAFQSPLTTGPVQYTHLLRMQSTRADIVLGKTMWRVKDRYAAAPAPH